MADAYQMFIDGEWVNSSDGQTRDVWVVADTLTATERVIARRMVATSCSTTSASTDSTSWPRSCAVPRGTCRP